MRGNTHNDSPFAPPAASAAPTVLIALALAVLVFAGVRLAGWWPSDTVEGAPSTSAVAEKTLQAPAAQAARPTQSTGRARAAETAAVSPPPTLKGVPQPAWSRCEIGGRVVYSDTACQGGVVKSNSQTTRAALSVVPPGAIRSAGTRNEAAQQALPRSTAPNTVPDHIQTAALDTTARECAHLDARIQQLDAQARQPQSGPMQDWLRSQRKAARDRQFALRC